MKQCLASLPTNGTHTPPNQWEQGHEMLTRLIFWTAAAAVIFLAQQAQVQHQSVKLAGDLGNWKKRAE